MRSFVILGGAALGLAMLVGTPAAAAPISALTKLDVQTDTGVQSVHYYRRYYSYGYAPRYYSYGYSPYAYSFSFGFPYRHHRHYRHRW
jgi:hypothetical protein